ncbi:MAG: TolC family protein [Chitinophagaceae bacterium]|nr:TolC family protein [Chitinophagaceae bacterium]
MKTNTRKGLIVLLLMIVSITHISAQVAKKISLEEAIGLSLQHSKQLKLAEAKTIEAGAALSESRQRRLPDVSASGAYMRVTQPNFNLKIPLSSSSSQQGSGESSGGSGVSSFPTVNEAMYGMASASLPIFSGFRINNGIQSAKYLKKAAELDAEHDKDEVIANTIAAYCNLYKATAALEIVNENLKQSQQRVADLENMERNGLLARNDLLKAQLQQSNIELAKLDAENNWKITYINMNLMLGLDEYTELEPEITGFTNYSDNNDFSFWENAALNNRADLKAMEMRKNAALAGVRAAKGEYYPSLALTGGYIALNVPKILTASNIINGGIGIKYSPSSLWKTGSKVAQAKSRLEQTRITQDILSDAARLESAQSYQQYLSSIKKIDVYKKAQEQATENYKIVKNKYDNSLATTTELLDADVALLQAKLNHAFAKADAFVAYNKLKQVTGTLEQATITK